MSDYSLYQGRKADGSRQRGIKVCPLDIAIFAAAAALVAVLGIANGLALIS